jgi:phage-related minor tail protein
MQSKLAAFKKSGAISGDDYTLFSGKIAQMRSEVDKGSSAMHGFSLNTAASRRELGYITKDLATGQYGRMSQSLSTLAVRSNALSLLMSPLAIGIGSVAAVVGVLAVAYEKGRGEQEAYNKAIILTGNYAQTTSASLAGMAIQLDSVSGVTQHSAAAALAAVVATGKFTGDQLQQVAQAALQMQIATG